MLWKRERKKSKDDIEIINGVLYCDTWEVLIK